MKTANKQGRQGDVLLVKVEAIGEGKPIPRENGKIVLAYGEVTGHSHVIASPFVKWIEVEGERYVESDKSFQVKHDEHTTEWFAPGTYLVIQQSEYTPVAIVTVRD